MRTQSQWLQLITTYPCFWTHIRSVESRALFQLKLERSKQTRLDLDFAYDRRSTLDFPFMYNMLQPTSHRWRSLIFSGVMFSNLCLLLDQRTPTRTTLETVHIDCHLSTSLTLPHNLPPSVRDLSLNGVSLPDWTAFTKLSSFSLQNVHTEIAPPTFIPAILRSNPNLSKLVLFSITSDSPQRLDEGQEQLSAIELPCLRHLDIKAFSTPLTDVLLPYLRLQDLDVLKVSTPWDAKQGEKVFRQLTIPHSNDSPSYLSLICRDQKPMSISIDGFFMTIDIGEPPEQTGHFKFRGTRWLGILADLSTNQSYFSRIIHFAYAPSKEESRPTSLGSFLSTLHSLESLTLGGKAAFGKDAIHPLLQDEGMACPELKEIQLLHLQNERVRGGAEDWKDMIPTLVQVVRERRDIGKAGFINTAAGPTFVLSYGPLFSKWSSAIVTIL